MKIISEQSGIKLLEVFHAEDIRGSFTKLYHKPDFDAENIPIYIEEIYYSVSGKDVIRGMHFQVPPADHEKLVSVISGSVVDVVVDLRRDSSSYQKAFEFHLSADKPQALYIPRGFAHGFRSLEENTVMMYMVSSGYIREQDAGIAFDSIDYDWKTDNPVLSKRDRSFPKMREFDSPF